MESDSEKNIKLLLVEDGPDDALLAQAHLQKAEGALSFEVTWVSTLDEALGHLTEEECDIVLLDLHLPDTKGVEGVERLCRLPVPPPLVVLTGSDADSLAQRSLQLGAQDFYVKSRLETESLVRCLRYAIERHRLLAEVREKEAQLQKLVSDYPDGIVIVSFDGVVRFANAKAAALLEEQADGLVGEAFEFELIDSACTEIDLSADDKKGKKVEMRVSTLVWEDEPVYMAAMHEVRS